MGRRIVILQGHSDPAGGHLLHALEDSYTGAATAGGHEVRRIDIATLNSRLLRTQEEFEKGPIPPALVQPQADLRWAEHWVFLFPLWHGTMPALVKGFLEQAFRPGFAMEYQKRGFPKRLLAGRSARVVGSGGDDGDAGAPDRWFFGPPGVRGFERSMLGFAGIRPIRESFFGLTGAGEKKRRGWIEDMRRHGRQGN